MASIHQSPFAGSWYPGGARELQELAELALESSGRRTGPCLLPNAIGFVVPHAGLMYSGVVAASVYRHLRAQKPRRAVVLGFSHHGGPRGVTIPDVEALATPLGATRVDRKAASDLLTQPGFHSVDEAAVCDHSVEIQLPLIQYATPATEIVPLYVGAMAASEQQRAAQALARLADDGTVFIASSDLTHFGRAFFYQPFPIDADTGKKLAQLDRRVMEDAASLDAELFLEGLAATGATVCGRAPIALLLRILAALAGPEEIFQQTLDYQTSGELTGDFRHSVSYGALGYFPASSFELAAEDAACLLALARATLARYLRAGAQGATLPLGGATALARNAGVFVTLRQNGKLRGCVGTPGGHGRLDQTVAEMVLSAALDDPRFPALAPGDPAAAPVEIEISVLSPMKRIRSRDSYRLHQHGAHLEAGLCRSLLLPQVASERRWTVEKFWDALARKAGLKCDVYDDPQTRLHVFRAQVIG